MALRNMMCLGEISYVCRPIKFHNFLTQKSLNYSIFNTNRTQIYNNTRGFKNSKRNPPKKQESFRTQETPFEGVVVETGRVPIRQLWKPLGFTVAICSTSFVGAAIWQYENIRYRTRRAIHNPVGWIKSKISYQNEKTYVWRQEINKWWNSLTEGERLFVPICFLNLLVYGAWRIPSLTPFMVKYFCSNPASRAICWPMVLSTFSHYSFFHILANMYVLHSFSSGAVSALGKEEFVGLYMSAGVISSLFSYLYKVSAGQAGLSLGASGAIMGVVGYVCSQYPDTTLSIIFLPMIQFSAGTAIKGLMALDLTGLVLGWKMFDHAAHLGGALTGILWCHFGHTYIWQKRDPLIRSWHKLREGDD